MRFLAFSPQAALALLAGVVAVIFLLYLLRPRRRRIVVSSNLIWRKVAAGQKFRSERWRWLLSLLLASVIGLSIALALTRPEVAAVGGVAKHVVLVMDNAPSMAARTRDGASRWEHATVRARKAIESAGVASEFMVLDTMGEAGIPAFKSRGEARSDVSRLKPATFGTARMPFIAQIGEARTEVHLFTDGVAALGVPEATQVESVFEPADNVAITAFEARAEPRDPTRYQALAQVFNASAANKHVTLELSGGGGFALARELDVPAGQMVNQIFDVSAFAGGTLRASVRSERDAFSLDDFAYAVVGTHAPRKVLLVSPGNRYLEDALKLMPGIQLTIMKPAGYATAPPVDAYVFDGFAPREPPTRGALVFGAPAGSWLGGAFVEVKKPTITQWDQAHPLASDVAWRELRVERAALARLASDTQQAAIVLANGSGEGALVSAGETPARWIHVGFALQDSNLHLQAGFPVFLSHALDWLSPQPQALARGLGIVELPFANAAIRDSENKPVASTASATTTLFEARKPGVYMVQSAQQQRPVVVNLLDPKLSEINRSRFSGAAPASTSSIAPRSPVEPWVLLLLLGAVLLVVEWLTFSRRLTV